MAALTASLSYIVFGIAAFIYGKRICGGIVPGLMLAAVSPVVLMVLLVTFSVLAGLVIAAPLALIGYRPSDAALKLFVELAMLTGSLLTLAKVLKLKPEK